MQEFRNTVTTLFFVALSLCTIIQPDLVYAAVDDEKSIEKLFETYGKTSVVEFISEKRNGSITIEKYKSFNDAYGKPNLTYITPKSVIQDLQILEMSVSQLASVLDERKKEHEKEKEAQENIGVATDASSNSTGVPLSVELNQKIIATKQQYDNASSDSERRRLQKELSILRTAYRRARENEKPKLRVYFPAEKKSTRYYNAAACESAKSRLQQITSAVYRHQVFFCVDREYRKQNPISCKGYNYGRHYGLKEYQEEVNRLNEQVTASCNP